MASFSVNAIGVTGSMKFFSSGAINLISGVEFMPETSPMVSTMEYPTGREINSRNSTYSLPTC